MKNPHAQACSRLTGRPIDRCAWSSVQLRDDATPLVTWCDLSAYAEGLCYNHFQLRAGAQALGKLGGLARAAKLSPAQRSEMAAKASNARITRKGWPKGRPRPK